MTASFHARIQFELAYHAWIQNLMVFFELNTGPFWKDYLEVFDRYEALLVAYAAGEPMTEDLELELESREYKQVLRMNVINMHWRDFALNTEFPAAMAQERAKERQLTLEITRRWIGMPNWKTDQDILPEAHNPKWDCSMAWRLHRDLHLPGSAEWVVQTRRQMDNTIFKEPKDDHQRTPKSPSFQHPGRGHAAHSVQ